MRGGQSRASSSAVASGPPPDVATATRGPPDTCRAPPAKASFSGAVSGCFNSLLFYNDLKDQKLNASLIPLPGFNLSPAQGIVNAGKSRIQGLEVDAQVSPVEGLRLNAGYAYLDSKLKSYTAPGASVFPGYQVIAGSVIGDPLPLTPKHRFTGTANYTLPLDESVGRITFGTTYTYTSKQQ